MPSFVTQRSLSRAQHKRHRSSQQRGGSAHEEGQRARRNAAAAGDRGGVKSGGEERREDAACTLRRLQQREVAPASLRRRVLRGESGAGRVGDGVTDPRQKEDQSVHRLRLDKAGGGKANAEEHQAHRARHGLAHAREEAREHLVRARARVRVRAKG